jgi:hypothetical protein
MFQLRVVRLHAAVAAIRAKTRAISYESAFVCRSLKMIEKSLARFVPNLRLYSESPQADRQSWEWR